jgi:hypothetical protein
MRALLLVLPLLLACAKPAQTGPLPDASDASPLLDGATTVTVDCIDPASCACLHLQALGCALGSSPNCAAAFRLPAKFGADPTCALDAGSIAALAACNVTCLSGP